MSFSLGDLNPFTAIAKVVIDRVVPDKNANATAKAELDKMVLSGELAEIAAQTDINKIEAASTDKFTSRWRPAVGWVCVLGLAIQFLVNPLFTWIATLVGHSVKFPDLDMGTLMVLLTTLLGMSGYRTVEKINGVASK